MAESRRPCPDMSFPLKIAPSHEGSGQRSNTCFLVQTQIQNNISIGSAVFAHLTTDSPYILQWAPLSPKIAPSHGVIWTPSNTRFLGTSRVLNLNGISIGWAILHGSLLWQTERRTERPRYLVGNNRAHLHT